MQGSAEAATGPGVVPEQFVINLCASTTPMALEQPKEGALKRFSFFISRRREDGRERFRLHMGYFASPEEAEEWLAIVREIYPAAWVGEAPGKKLRAAARADAQRAAQPAQVAAILAPDEAPVPGPPSALPATHTPPTAPATVAAPIAFAAPAVPPVVAAAARTGTPATVAALSNVHEVLAQLDASDGEDAEAGEPGVAASPPAHTLYVPPPPVLPEHIPTVRALTPAPMMPAPRPPAAAAVAAPVAAAPPAAKPAPLTDTQVLRVLEERRAEGAASKRPATPDERAATAIEMLRPEDTRTMRALKEDVQRNAPAQFAVQLAWSVTPIDVSAVPPLAIFGAYTLYTVESSRDGRKWYGLRLGFFSDALSAKQVAYYVRSDFAAVAVVPVTTAEKDTAVAGARVQPAAARKRGTGKAVEEFKLFDADQPPAKPAPSADAVRAKLAVAAKSGNHPAAGGRAKPALRKKARSLEESLEQTLEILGAGDLEIDKGRGEVLNDTGVRHLSVKVDKRTSTFAKLLDRLSDRVGKG
ncbi:MAG: hypothetical protein AB7P31_12885 [Steroidobacteraceae bacterium]